MAAFRRGTSPPGDGCLTTVASIGCSDSSVPDNSRRVNEKLSFAGDVGSVLASIVRVICYYDSSAISGPCEEAFGARRN
jgi:hypothetical protein